MPFVLTGAVTAERGYDAEWWDLTRQSELFPNSPTDFYPQGMNSDGIKTQPWFTPVPEAVAKLRSGAFEALYEDWDASLTTAYMQWNIDHGARHFIPVAAALQQAALQQAPDHRCLFCF